MNIKMFVPNFDMPPLPGSGTDRVFISLLTPNEKRLIIGQERRKRRLLRLMQVRIEADKEARRIRTEVQRDKRMELAKIRTKLKARFERDKSMALHRLRRKISQESAVKIEHNGENSKQLSKNQNIMAINRHKQAIKNMKKVERDQKSAREAALEVRRRAVKQANERCRGQPDLV